MAAACRSVAGRREAPLLWLRRLLRPACQIHAVVLACTRQVLRLFLSSGHIHGARPLALAHDPEPWQGFQAGHRFVAGVAPVDSGGSSPSPRSPPRVAPLPAGHEIVARLSVWSRGTRAGRPGLAACA